MGTIREVVFADVLVSLRLAVGQPPTTPLAGEELASLGREMPERVEVDPGLWVAWCVGGLVLLDGRRQPTGSATVKEARRLAAAMAMQRWGGNLTHAAAMLETSRRALRELLRAVRLYPWPGRRLSRSEFLRELAGQADDDAGPEWSGDAGPNERKHAARSDASETTTDPCP